MRTLAYPAMVLVVGMLATKLAAADALTVQPVPATATPTYTTATLTKIDPWTVVSAGESPYFWQIIWTGNMFVTVGSNGAILTSPDGLTWKKALSNTSTHLYGVASNGKVTAVAGDKGTILVSADLVNWSIVPLGITTRLFSMIWMGTQFVALGDTNTVVTSPDGSTWTIQPPSSGYTFHHGTWTGSLAIATAVEGIVVSQNGVDWQKVFGSSVSKMYDVASNGNISVAVGGVLDTVYSSTDGMTWATRTLPASISSLGGIKWTGTEFLGVGSGDFLIRSPDGITWSARHIGTGLVLSDIAAHGDTMVAVSTDGSIIVNKKVEKAVAPEIAFAPGAPGSTPQLQLSTTTPNAKIYYSDDGSDPNKKSSPYMAPFSPTHSGMIKARAFRNDMPPSDVTAAQFTIEPADASAAGAKP
jgi:hypothetical protein